LKTPILKLVEMGRELIGGGYRDLYTETAPLSTNGLLGMFTDGIDATVDMANA
jgi:hypothetical protein